MAKEKRASWFKMFRFQRSAIESVSDEDAGLGLKAAMRYFDDDDVSPDAMTQGAFTVFCVMRPYIDEAKEAYRSSVEYGEKGACKRWGGRHIAPL